VQSELSDVAFANAKETLVIKEALSHEGVEAIGTARSPIAMDLDDERPLRRLEFDVEDSGRTSGDAGGDEAGGDEGRDGDSTHHAGGGTRNREPLNVMLRAPFRFPPLRRVRKSSFASVSVEGT
jgi:hypothetical protein